MVRSRVEVEVWYRVGLVERPRLRKGRRLSYLWFNGYSTTHTGKAQPWVTYKEAQVESKANGKRAMFIDPRDEEKLDLRGADGQPRKRKEAHA